jgi:hypothetical protein
MRDEMPKTIEAFENMVDAPLGKNEEKDCICPRCPSYPDCAVDQELRMFCMRGKVHCQVRRKGCMCRGCKVHIEHRFTMEFYCIIGTEEEQERIDR